MNGVSAAITCWVEQERRSERTSAAVLSVLGLGGGAVVFSLIALPIYVLLFTTCRPFVQSAQWLGLAAVGLGRTHRMVIDREVVA